MFDISWTDPARETVGQRKTRKEQQQANGTSRAASIRSSKSSASSQTQAKPALFSLFGSGKKGGLTRTNSHSKLSITTNEQSSKSSRRISSYTVTSDTSARESIGPSTTTRIPVSGFFAASESVFSGWTGRSAATESSWGSTTESPPGKRHIIQPLSPTSFVTQSTEVTVSPRDSIKSGEQLATVVHISAAATVPIEINDSPTEEPPGSSIFDFPIPKLNLPEKYSAPAVTHNVDLRRPLVLRGRQDAWKPPEVWQCPPDGTQSAKPAMRLVSPPKSIDIVRQRSPVVEVTYLQRSIRRMEAASSKIILERLKKEWVAVADASVYRELELEKQLWMLSALRSLKSSSETKLENNGPLLGVPIALSLYENHASASFLSALTPFADIHHLSVDPLSPKSYPNVQPLIVPGPTSQLPFASNIFSSIHAFSLPAALPASSLPAMLKECHRTLTSDASSPPSPTIPGTSPPRSARAGTLHLTILDPSPLPSTLGPLLRAWLDSHLILNLEKQFRCINPSRLFPIWLEDEGLRAEGSTRLTVLFLASVNAKDVENLLIDPETGAGIDEVEKAKCSMERAEIVKQELKSVVGRMLWKEIWGSFVQAE
ncbi:hypothetical protein LSUE1_G004967, partial [Lachnellula suecica]